MAPSAAVDGNSRQWLTDDDDKSPLVYDSVQLSKTLYGIPDVLAPDPAVPPRSSTQIPISHGMSQDFIFLICQVRVLPAQTTFRVINAASTAGLCGANEHAIGNTSNVMAECDFV